MRLIVVGARRCFTSTVTATVGMLTAAMNAVLRGVAGQLGRRIAGIDIRQRVLLTIVMRSGSFVLEKPSAWGIILQKS